MGAPVTRRAATAPDDAIRALYARLDDLARAAARGELVVTDFLTPRERKYATAYLSSRNSEGTACMRGGYDGAERVRAVLLPDYVAGLVPADDGEDVEDALRVAGFSELADGVRDTTAALKITGSGYRELTHRDYLGSVLGLGLERDAVGDIQVADEHTAYLIAKGEIAEFLLQNLTKVASDTVKVTLLSGGEVVPICRRTQAISDTVASERLDCVVAALANLSRDKAQTAVRSGLVEMDYETAEDCDEIVTPPCVISIRGIGKFHVTAFDGETRKGRVKLRAEKYI